MLSMRPCKTVEGENEKAEFFGMMQRRYKRIARQRKLEEHTSLQHTTWGRAKAQLEDENEEQLEKTKESREKDEQ